MQTPSRLIPAIRALVWAVPITPASLNSIVSRRRPPSAFSPSRTASSRTSARWRWRSPQSRMQPLTIRKMAAARGLARATRTGCSSSSPRMPTGIVAQMISQASRSVGVSIRRLPRVAKKPLMIATQSRQK